MKQTHYILTLEWLDRDEWKPLGLPGTMPFSTKKVALEIAMDVLDLPDEEVSKLNRTHMVVTRDGRFRALVGQVMAPCPYEDPYDDDGWWKRWDMRKGLVERLRSTIR